MLCHQQACCDRTLSLGHHATFPAPPPVPRLHPGAPQAQALWREVREISGGAMLMYRRLERAMMRRRLEAAAALIAGGGLRGPPAATAQARGRLPSLLGSWA